jgi:polar amino acid transport system substrate-binding protein
MRLLVPVVRGTPSFAAGTTPQLKTPARPLSTRERGRGRASGGSARGNVGVLRKALALLFLVALLGATAACGGDDDESEPEAAPPTEAADTGATDTAAEEPDPCAKEQLQTVVPGSLSIGTDNPAFPPWFQDEEGAPWDPTSEPTKMGYEAAVAYAVAGELGYADDEVRWVVVPFNASFRPGPKDFDFDINQISYLPARDQNVDFSDSYYDVEQAVVVLKNSDFADATTLEELKGAKLGAQVGTTSYDAIVNTIQPDEDPQVYDRNDDAVNALRNGQIDGIVVDFPTSLFITAVQAPNATTIGRLPAEGQEYFGLVFEEGNPLRDCVNEAIAALREAGTLDEIAQEWIEGSAPPILE